MAHHAAAERRESDLLGNLDDETPRSPLQGVGRNAARRTEGPAYRTIGLVESGTSRGVPQYCRQSDPQL